MAKVFCFGELLLRLSPAANSAWITENYMPVHIGGAELNVAQALSKWKVPVAYCTALPDHYLSKEIEQFVQQKNIDTSAFIYSGQRIGLYYLQQGTDLKHAGVIYDRAHSSFAELKPGQIDWDKKLEGVEWFHFSAISPALSRQAADVCKEALEAAAKKNIIISVDLNYRAKLWQYGEPPATIMPQLVQYCDVVMGNIWAANTLLGVPVDEHIHSNGSKEAYLAHAKETSLAIQQQFPKCKAVANTFRFDHGEKGIRYYTSLYSNGTQYNSTEFIADQIVDKVGSGDCFMGGLIYGMYHQHPPQQVINFAAAAAFGKLQEQGDATKQSIEAVLQIIAQNG